MTIINGYCTRAQLTAELDSSGSATIDNVRLDRIAYQASRTVENWTNRRFYPQIETRFFTPKYTDVLWVTDLLSVTTLTTDTDGDRTYETTWAATDYDLEPFNADEIDQPYSAIRLAPQTYNYFPKVRRGVQIVGKWGYYEVTDTSGSLLAGAIADTTSTSVPVDDGTDFSVGHILKVDNEYMRVDSISTNTLTVVRGINGSTAATHLDDAVVYVLTFPGITEIVLRLATRMWHLRKAPMGIATAGVQGMDGSTAGTRWIQEDRDLQGWLAPFVGGKML